MPPSKMSIRSAVVICCTSNEFNGSAAAPVLMYTLQGAAAPVELVAPVALSSGTVFHSDAQGNAVVKTYQ